MRNERGVISLILGIAVLFIFVMPEGIMAKEKQVTKELKKTIDEVVLIVNDEKLKQDPKARREMLRDTINKRFNYDQMAVRALAENWSPRTSEERKKFTQRFKNLLERSYAEKIESFSNGKIRFTDELVKGKYALVKTRVESQGKFINLDYKLIQENGEWKIYDFVIKGVSIIHNYRHQFSKALKKQSFGELLEKLEKSGGENIT